SDRSTSLGGAQKFVSSYEPSTPSADTPYGRDVPDPQHVGRGFRELAVQSHRDGRPRSLPGRPHPGRRAPAPQPARGPPRAPHVVALRAPLGEYARHAKCPRDTAWIARIAAVSAVSATWRADPRPSCRW